MKHPAVPPTGPAPSAGIDALTPRLREVLELLAEGLPNKEIAYLMGISPATVKAHVAALFRRLGAESRLEAAMLFWLHTEQHRNAHARSTPATQQGHSSDTAATP